MREKKAYGEAFIRLMGELERYPLVFKDRDQKEAVGAGLSKEATSLNIVVEAPDARRLRPWQPPKPLKQRILERDDPRLEVYRKLINAWPDITDAKLREILEGTPLDRIEKVLEIHDACGKLFTEFLEPNLTYEQILMLDNIRRYYILLREARGAGLLDNLKEGFKYKLQIDSKKYDAELFAFLDDKRVSLNFYPDQFNRPSLGIPYSDWPCLQKARERLRQRAEALAASLKELAFNNDELMGLKAELEHLKGLEQDFMPLSVENFITIPVKYTMREGVLGPHLYINHVTIPCGLCNRQHSIWLIAKVR